MKTVAVKEDESLGQFAERWGLSIDVVKQHNGEVMGGMGFSRMKISKLRAPMPLGVATLLVPDDAVEAGSQPPAAPVTYDLRQNNIATWDWILWETEGNSDPKFQRGGKERKLGLYSLNYNSLRRAGQSRQWAAAHTDGTIGGGWVKVAILDQEDYRKHQALIQTFLPCLAGNADNVIGEASEDELVNSFRGAASRSPSDGTGASTFDKRPPLLIMPFNYDDNSDQSKAIGRVFDRSPLVEADAQRLEAELPRWATASRSTITAFPSQPPSHRVHSTNRDQWDLRPHVEGDMSLPQVVGSPGKTLLEFQADPGNAGYRYYSVKTGVNFVATQEQGTFGKDQLESNSIHAMSRSNVIAGTIKRRGKARFEAEYQLEILSILLNSGGQWDGIQIRDVGDAGRDEIWFPALAIPTHGKAFAEAWQPGCVWTDFWRDNFAVPLGRAKAEMLAYFGLQHMTSNAQNFLIAFDRASPGTDAKRVILRDIGDTLLNGVFFEPLKEIDPDLFRTMWDTEVADQANGIVLEQDPAKRTIGGAYANPQITRLGTGIVFFFLPFLKGELDVDSNPRSARIAAEWSIASNDGFCAYMKEKVALAASSGGIDRPDPKLVAAIREKADLSLSGKSPEYPTMSNDVLKLSWAARDALREAIVSDIRRMDPASMDDVRSLQSLVAGHEVLICADVHTFVQSQAGKQALQDLHTSGGRAAPPQQCALCQADLSLAPRNAQRCGDCGARYCAACTARLPYPRGTPEQLKASTEARRCTADSEANMISGTCDGITEPL